MSGSMSSGAEMSTAQLVQQVTKTPKSGLVRGSKVASPHTLKMTLLPIEKGSYQIHQVVVSTLMFRFPDSSG